MTPVEQGTHFEGAPSSNLFKIKATLQWICWTDHEARANERKEIFPVYQDKIGKLMDERTHTIDQRGQYRGYTPAGYTLGLPSDPSHRESTRWFGVSIARDESGNKFWMVEDTFVWDENHYQGAVYKFDIFPGHEMITKIFRQKSYTGDLLNPPKVETRFLEHHENETSLSFSSGQSSPRNLTEAARRSNLNKRRRPRVGI